MLWVAPVCSSPRGPFGQPPPQSPVEQSGPVPRVLPRPEAPLPAVGLPLARPLLPPPLAAAPVEPRPVEELRLAVQAHPQHEGRGLQHVEQQLLVGLRLLAGLAELQLAAPRQPVPAAQPLAVGRVPLHAVECRRVVPAPLALKELPRPVRAGRRRPAA